MTRKISKKKTWIIIAVVAVVVVIVVAAVVKGRENEGLRVATEKVNAQTEAFKYAQQKFDVGVMTSFDYNNSKKELTLAESQLLQAKYDFIFKTTILDFYMGNPIRIERE